MGQAALSMAFSMKLGTCVRIGKKIASSGFFTCFSKSRLWICACTTFDG
jgi:hypothetical protein